jgi:hypothetical protein
MALQGDHSTVRTHTHTPPIVWQAAGKRRKPQPPNPPSPTLDFKIKIKEVKVPKVPKCYHYVRFEAFTAVTMKNGVFWDVFTRVTRHNIPEDTILHVTIKL